MTMPTQNRQRLLLLVAAGCLALLLLDRLVLTPFLSGWRQRADDIVRLRAAIDHGSAVIDQEARWRRWQDEMHSRMLPATPAEAENMLLNRVDAWARDAGLNVRALRPGWKETADRRPLLELQITGTGHMSAVVRFLHALETGPLALAVEQVDLAAAGDASVALSVDVRVSGLCHSAPNAKNRSTM